MGSSIVKTLCFECHSLCGVLLEVTDGKITKFAGDKDHPFSRGYTCVKGRACMEIVDSPLRITKPLLRTGKRGENKFEPVSWDKALDVISENLLEIREKWGAESFALGLGTNRGMGASLFRFMALYGTPNSFGPGQMCAAPVFAAGAITTGFVPFPDYRHSKCILLWANNADEAWPGLYGQSIQQARKEGAKLIVVDPRPTKLAKKADHWLQIRPGSDTALALCFLNVIISRELYDKEFVEKWTSGFDKLREHVASFTPERCAEITWLSADKIVAAAELFAQTKPACLAPGLSGATLVPNAFDLNRALFSIAAITGNLDIPGGLVDFVPPTGDRWAYGPAFTDMSLLPPGQADKAIGLDVYPITTRGQGHPDLYWKAMLEGKPYPIKGVGLFANNATCAYPNSKLVKKALSNLDFLFCVDFFHTPTTALADVILPPAHWTERDAVEDMMLMNHVFCMPKAMDPVGECRDEKQIVIDLAKRMGLQGYFNSVEELLDYRLSRIGMTYEELKKIGQFSTPVEYKKHEKNGRFGTISGKVELYSELMQQMGGSALPVYREPLESPLATPELYKEYPLILTGGKKLAFYLTALRQIPSLNKLAPDPELDINPKTAAAMFGVEDGEWVWLKTLRGKVEIKIRYNEDMHPNVVSAPHGYWYGVENGWERLNINQILSNEPQCAVSGAVPARGALSKIEKMTNL